MSLRKIGLETGVNASTVSRIVKKYEAKGSLSPCRKGKCGRKSVLTATQKRLLLRKSRIDPRKTAGDLQTEVAPEVNTRTVRRVLFNAGRVARRPSKKQLLTKKMMLKRLQWGKEA